MPVLAKVAPILGRRRLSVALSATTASAAAEGAGPHTTASVTATPSGGVGPYSYAWSRVSGDSSISTSAATSAATTWSASGTVPSTKTAAWKCTVTDASGATADSANVSVSVQFSASTLSASATSSVTGSGTGAGPHTTSAASVSVSGGVGPYSYLWEYVSGSGSISAVSSTSASTTFSASGTPTETKTGSWRCKVTDSLGAVAYTGGVSISITFSYAALSATATTPISGARDHTFGAGTCTSDDPSVCTASGGSGSYTYLWELVSGSSSIGANTSSSASTYFSAYFPMPDYRSAVYRCKVTDTGTGSVAYSNNVDVSLESFL